MQSNRKLCICFRLPYLLLFIVNYCYLPILGSIAQLLTDTKFTTFKLYLCLYVTYSFSYFKFQMFLLCNLFNQACGCQSRYILNINSIVSATGVRMITRRRKYFSTHPSKCQVDLWNRPVSNLHPVIESPYATFHLLAIAIFALSVTVCKISTVELYMTLTFRTRQSQMYL